MLDYFVSSAINAEDVSLHFVSKIYEMLLCDTGDNFFVVVGFDSDFY